MSPNDPTLQQNTTDDASADAETAPRSPDSPRDSMASDPNTPESNTPQPSTADSNGTPPNGPQAPPAEGDAAAPNVATTTPPTVLAATDRAADSSAAGQTTEEDTASPPAPPETPIAASEAPSAGSEATAGADSPRPEPESAAPESPVPDPAARESASAESSQTEPAAAPGPSAEGAAPESAASPQASAEGPPPESPAVSDSGESAETARRVTLDRSAGEDAKAVPTIPSDSSPAEGEAGSKDSPEPRPNAPVTGVEIPKSAELDPAMEEELTAALSKPSAPADGSPDQTGGGPAEAPVDIEHLQPGTKLKGTVQLVGEETVFIDLGLRSPGMIATRQFPEGKPPETGQAVDVIVDKVDPAAGTLTVNLPKAKRKPAGNWDAVAKGQIVDAMVSKTNKGGLEVNVSNLRGFLPASQVDLGFVEDLEVYVGQKLTCIVTEVNPQKRNLVLSRRAFLHQERKEREKELWATLAAGQQLEGTVKTIKDYGAFVDLGGVDGFLHVGEISWNRIGHPSDVLAVGQTIQVSILKIDPESRKIGLGMKQLQENPWSGVAERYPIGSTVSGKVTRVADFGAFVELEEGVEGLIHISELDHRRVGRVTEVVNVGDQVDVKVLGVEPKRKRISLSLKALKDKPEPVKKSAAEAPRYERKRKEPLRGGREGGPGGGLFGNPDDFR